MLMSPSVQDSEFDNQSPPKYVNRLREIHQQQNTSQLMKQMTLSRPDDHPVNASASEFLMLGQVDDTRNDQVTPRGFFTGDNVLSEIGAQQSTFEQPSVMAVTPTNFIEIHGLDTMTRVNQDYMSLVSKVSQKSQ